MDKTYVAQILLGVTTDTWDLEGQVTLRSSIDNINKAAFVEAVEGLKGNFIQQPPVYSAKKINGKPAYHYVRNKGIDADKIILKKNMVRIYDISAEFFCAGKAVLKIKCSSGTYIRSVVHEIGQRLGCGAILTGLLRTEIGSFNIENSTSLEELERISLTKKTGSEELQKNYRGIIAAESILY
jgi:tRNA pseudouridine55 synthase